MQIRTTSLTFRLEAWPFPLFWFDRLLTFHLCFRRYHWIEFCSLAMTHHCFPFLISPFENWVLHLKRSSLSFLSLVPTVPQAARLPGSYQHCGVTSSDAFQKAHQISVLCNQGIKAGVFPSVFRYLTKNCFNIVWFSRSGGGGESGFKRSDVAKRKRDVLLRNKT